MEAAEIQCWIRFATDCQYLNAKAGNTMHEEYDEIIAMLAAMLRNADKWLID